VAGLATKRIYAPETPDEGYRVLVMRLWPRGIKKGRVDVWLRELAPELPLMKGFRAGGIPWDDYRVRYLAGLARDEAQAQLEELRAALARGPVTIFCACTDPRRCHRELLRAHVESDQRS
jgi:uncharacterized protein YeaO (DUF488 family)